MCAITRELFTDPVVTSLGNTYERSAIEKHFASGAVTCPLTNEPLPDRKLTPNKHLKSQVENFRQNVLSANKFKTAIESGDLKTLETSPFWPMEDYKTVDPLFLAVKSNQLNVLRYLLKEFDTNPAKIIDGDGNSLLHRAGTSSPEMIRYLVGECKIGLEEKNIAGHTPLLQILCNSFSGMICIPKDTSPMLSTIRELLVCGASPQCRTDISNVFSVGPFFPELGKLLVQYGAGVSAIVEQVFAHNGTVLHRRWSGSPTESVLFEYFLSLISSKERRVALVRQVMHTGNTLLHMSLRNPEILKLLLAPPYSLSSTLVDKAGLTYLHHWARTDNDPDTSEETLAILLAAGIDIDGKTNAGMTALEYASSTDMVRFHQLMMAGANSAFDSLSSNNLRVLYLRSLETIHESKRHANEKAFYIGQKIEVLKPNGVWVSAKIIQVLLCSEFCPKLNIFFVNSWMRRERKLRFIIVDLIHNGINGSISNRKKVE